MKEMAGLAPVFESASNRLDMMMMMFRSRMVSLRTAEFDETTFKISHEMKESSHQI